MAAMMVAGGCDTSNEGNGANSAADAGGDTATSGADAGGDTGSSPAQDIGIDVSTDDAATASPGGLCESTAGTWDASSETCDCGNGGAYLEGEGCTAATQALCESTAGIWTPTNCGPYCGVCECTESDTWSETEGCIPSQSVEECIAECGDGCFGPAQQVCGTDGQFGCPCEMACKGIAVADDPQSCCEPVPSNCIATCQDNVAMNCSTTTDEYGCWLNVWDETPCEAETCVVDYDMGLASCEAGEEALCTSTAGVWSAADGTCDCGPGGEFDGTVGCHNPDYEPCIATGGTWLPLNCGTYCGECQCGENQSFTPGVGCQTTGDLEACLLACGDGCFGPNQQVCGEDGKFGCPCEMGCYGIAVATDPMTCCEPVPPGCVASCNAGFAQSCTVTTDEYGCPKQSFTDIACGGMACLTSTPSGEAHCVDPCAPMDAELGTGECDTAWGWKWNGSACAYLGGTCTCDGADCYALYESEESCLAVHGVCQTTPDTETLCKSTSGFFADGACDCAEGGAFDPTFGCYPAWALLCLEAGGDWMPAFCGPFCGDCTCPGITSFDPILGCTEG